MINNPRVGVAVIICKEKFVLMGKRKNAHGTACWSFPGGHLEFGETPEQCAQREVLEETGLVVSSIRPYAYTNDIFVQENKHYISLFMLADYIGGEPHVCEPDKCENWHWFAYDASPQPLFLTIENLIKQKNNKLIDT
jgi:8-oxo-dGTP diphosphatase